MENDYLLEKVLKDGDSGLHKRMRESVFVLKTMLWSFLDRFPRFTDHSLLHSMSVIDYCNRIIGPEQVAKLCPEECYVLLMACYLHDIGMGINDKDVEAFSEKIDFGDYLENHELNDAHTVRAFHHEYSGLFIEKYAALFDFPSVELTYAIIQTSRGHRKTDLFDENEYYNIQAGSAVIRTPYLAAVIRIADEIDVASDRNPEFLFDTSGLTDACDIEAFGTHESILRVEVEGDEIQLYVRPKSEEYVSLLDDIRDTIQGKLDYCREVAEKRSDLRIMQNKVVLIDT